MTARRATLTLLILATLLLTTAPLWIGLYWMRVMSAVFMLAVVAQGINLMAGYTGYPGFGNVVFFGLGAYATAILSITFSSPSCCWQPG